MIWKILIAFLYFGIIFLLGGIAWLLSRWAFQEINKKEESERINKSLEHLAARRV